MNKPRVCVCVCVYIYIYIYNGEHVILTDSPSERKCERYSNTEDTVGRRRINIGGTNQNVRCGIE